MKIASRATLESLAGHSLSTTVISEGLLLHLGSLHLALGPNR